MQAPAGVQARGGAAWVEGNNDDADKGIVPVQVRLRVWRHDSAGVRNAVPLFDLHTDAGAVEVGGGPWWSTWQAQVWGHCSVLPAVETLRLIDTGDASL